MCCGGGQQSENLRQDPEQSKVDWVVMAALGIAQERAQTAAGEDAKASLRARIFARLLAQGPADQRPVGEKSALVVERVEAMEGYFARWMPAAIIAIVAPLLIAGCAALFDPVSGLILLVAGLMVPVAQAASGIGAAQASRRQFAALQRLSGRFLDRMRGLPVLVLFNQQRAETQRLAAAAEELRQRTMRVLRVAFISSGAMELIAAAALACLAIRHGAVRAWSGSIPRASAGRHGRVRHTGRRCRCCRPVYCNLIAIRPRAFFHMCSDVVCLYALLLRCVM
jgi:ATP-binding cassette subfamily C protein CydD